MEPTLSTFEDLMRPSIRRYKTVTLPISKRNIRIRSLTEDEIADFQGSLWKADGTRLDRVKLSHSDRRFIILCVVDAEGNQLLNDSHVRILGKWDRADTQYLYDECSSHVGMKPSDIEVLSKNCETIAADD